MQAAAAADDDDDVVVESDAVAVAVGVAEAAEVVAVRACRQEWQQLRTCVS